MENNTNNENSGIGFSVLDFFAILIRYRKIILIIPFVFLILSVGYFYLLPKIIKQFDEKKIEVVYTANIETVTPKLIDYINIKIPELAEKNLKDYINFSKVEKNYHIFSSPEMTLREYNTSIKNIIEHELFSVDTSNPSQFKIKTELREDKLESYDLFIHEYISFCSKILEKQMEESCSAAEKNINDLILKYETQDKSSTDISSLISLQLEFQNFRKTHKEFISIEGVPFETTIAKKNAKKVLLFTFISLICAIFIAFVLDAVNEIQKDPESRKIISDAWKAGK